MRLNKLSVATLCIGMMFVACQKEQPLAGTKKQSSTTETAKAGDDPMGDFFRAVRAKKTVSFTIDAGKGGQFTGSGGAIVTVQANALHTQDGTPVAGPVTGTLLELRTIADVATMGFPTQSVWDPQTQTGGAPLQTGGSFELKFTAPNGEELTANGNGVTIAVPVLPGTTIDPAMGLWTGQPAPDQPRDNAWKQDQGEVGHMGSYYLVNWEGRPRRNIDKLYTCPGTPTPFRVDLPAGFNKMNTEIYVVATVCGSPGPKAVFALDVYNAMPIWWSEHTAAGIPVGMTVDFVAIANIGGSLFFKIENATIVPNHFQHMSGMAPTTLPALNAALNAL